MNPLNGLLISFAANYLSKSSNIPRSAPACKQISQKTTSWSMTACRSIIVYKFFLVKRPITVYNITEIRYLVLWFYNKVTEDKIILVLSNTIDRV